MGICIESLIFGHPVMLDKTTLIIQFWLGFVDYVNTHCRAVESFSLIALEHIWYDSHTKKQLGLV